MSSSDRRVMLAAMGAIVLLGGCFRPMLAENSNGAAIRGTIVLPPIDDRFSYDLRQTLEDRLGAAGPAPKYRLAITTSIKERGVAITQNNAVTRRNLFATANWALYPIGGNVPILRDRTVSQSGYSATGSLYAGRVTRQDIERRLAVDLGERISRAILARAPKAGEADGS